MQWEKLVWTITEVLPQSFWKFTGHKWDEHLGIFEEVVVMGPHRDDGGLSPKISRSRVYLIHQNTFLRTHFTLQGEPLTYYIHISYIGNI